MTSKIYLNATTASELINILAKKNIAVPLRSEGRNKDHKEKYAIARLLATLAQTNLISYPIEVRHQDKPDFRFAMRHKTIGVECVEAVSADLSEIYNYRELNGLDDSMLLGERYDPKGGSLGKKHQTKIATNQGKGYAWEGNLPERDWAEAIAYFIKRKTEKLRLGNYSDFTENWLVIEDNWSVPALNIDEALNFLYPKIQSFLTTPKFEKIYLCRSNLMVSIHPSPALIVSVNNLWVSKWCIQRQEISSLQCTDKSE